MRPSRWFLPEEPDVIGLLRRQTEETVAGVDALAEWAAGDPDAARSLLACEERGDRAKREVLSALRVAFVTPLEPEDAFALSRGIDWILNLASDLVSEAEVMRCTPDAGIAEIAALLGAAVRRIDGALEALGRDGEAATEAAEAAIETERRIGAAYYEGMAALLAVEEMRERIGRRELYRRLSRIGEIVIDVAERVMYAVVKQS